jgi:nicotinamide-nucleotide amidase
MFEVSHTAVATQLLERCRAQGLRIVTAESCTGGLVAALLTSIPGASQVFEAGMVTYSNDAKTLLIGVADDIVRTHGAVSEETARAMADGALLTVGRASLALAVTGIAGPDGGTATKPVGLIHIAAARRHRPTLHRKLLLGNAGREAIRIHSVAEAVELGLAQTLGEP